MKNVFVGLTLLLLSQEVHAASAMSSLYMKSAAAWERCTGGALSAAQAGSLADLIARHPLESAAPREDEILREIRRARDVLEGCDLPLTKFEREYFEKWVLPRLAETPTSPARIVAPTDAAGR